MCPHILVISTIVRCCWPKPFKTSCFSKANVSGHIWAEWCNNTWFSLMFTAPQLTAMYTQKNWEVVYLTNISMDMFSLQIQILLHSYKNISLCLQLQNKDFPHSNRVKAADTGLATGPENLYWHIILIGQPVRDFEKPNIHCLFSSYFSSSGWVLFDVLCYSLFNVVYS